MVSSINVKSVCNSIGYTLVDNVIESKVRCIFQKIPKKYFYDLAVDNSRAHSYKRKWDIVLWEIKSRKYNTDFQDERSCCINKRTIHESRGAGEWKHRRVRIVLINFF